MVILFSPARHSIPANHTEAFLHADCFTCNCLYFRQSHVRAPFT
jgi:hypothetical protein